MDLEPIGLPGLGQQLQQQPSEDALSESIASFAGRTQASEPEFPVRHTVSTAFAPDLHNPRVANYEVQSEKPHHRAAAYLFAAGNSALEVARALDVTPQSARDWLKIKWFQDRVTSLMAENGGGDIIALFKAEQVNSFVTLIEIRDDPKVSPTVRSNIANSILDRAGGKAITRIETTSVPASTDPIAEVARLQQETDRLRSTIA